MSTTKRTFEQHATMTINDPSSEKSSRQATKDGSRDATVASASIALSINKKGRTDATVVQSHSDDTTDEAVLNVFRKTFKKGTTHDERFECISAAPSVPIYTGRKVRVQNGLLATVHDAFANELPLALSPDHVWAAIAQAVSVHVNENAKELRDVFVSHQDKQEIEVRTDALTFGDPKSPWHQVFPVFVQKLREAIKVRDFATHMVADFSTTGPVQGIVHTLALMDSLKEYFEYSVLTMCGIPRIDLLGTVDDWRRLRSAAESVLSTVHMQWWAGELLPVLDQFVALADGTCDKTRAATFWERIYAVGGAGGSGVMPYATGWILVFFPYKVSGGGYERRPVSEYTSDDLTSSVFWDDRERQTGLAGHGGLDYKRVPSGTSCVPFTWKEYKTTMQDYSMSMCGGFLAAVGVGPNGTVTPAFGWAVAHNKAVDSAALDTVTCRHGLQLSNNSTGAYANGWFCDQCSAHFPPGSRRWNCAHCEKDVCTSCKSK